MRINDREYNRLRTLKALRRAEPIGRTDLAKLSGLDGATITEISGTLLARNLILEEKVPTGKRGRPQRHLRLNPQGAHAAAAYIGAAGHVVCEIVNLRGDRLHIASRAKETSATLQDWAESIASLLDIMIDESGYDRSTLSRIGISLPAVIDAERGVLHWLQTYDCQPFHAAGLIERILGLPVSIDNNTNVLARAEHWFGDAGNPDDFTLINLGYGISGAVYSNGMLSAGTHGLNSELGHSKIMAEGGLPCSCGAHGCLDVYCSVTALVRQSCLVTGTPMPGIGQISDLLSHFAQQAREGRSEIRQLFERAGRYLGIAIANHINSFDPGRIILLCEHPDLPEIFSTTLDTVETNCLLPMKGLTAIEFRPFEQDLFGKGAAALVLEQLYRSL